jgi:hypothetical protein
MKGRINLVQVLQWVAGTIIVATSTVFTVMRFAYSDFQTTRETETYRTQIEKRLDDIKDDVKSISQKLDIVIERERSHR